MIIQAYKCTKTNRLFEHEADYLEHIRLTKVRAERKAKARQTALTNAELVKEFQELASPEELTDMLVKHYKQFREIPRWHRRVGVVKSAEMTPLVWGLDTRNYYGAYLGWRTTLKLTWASVIGPHISDVLSALGFENPQWVSNTGRDAKHRMISTHTVNLTAGRFENLSRREIQPILDVFETAKQLPVEPRIKMLPDVIEAINAIKPFAKVFPSILPFPQDDHFINTIMGIFPEREIMWRYAGDDDLVTHPEVVKRVQDGRMIRVDYRHESYLLADHEEAIWAKMAGLIPRYAKMLHRDFDVWEVDPPF